MKKLLLIFVVLILTSCTTTIETTDENIPSKITYWKDKRTSLCFASLHSLNTYGGVVSITNVPCTKEVEILAKAEKGK